MRIGIGDVVLHVPSGEKWLVARADDNHVWPIGWPCCRADIKDCELIMKATDEERAIFSDELRGLPQGDPRRVEP